MDFKTYENLLRIVEDTAFYKSKKKEEKGVK